MSMLALTVMAPFIMKVSSTGFTPLAWARSEKCEVFKSHVLMTRTYGTRAMVYEFPYTTSDSLEDLVTEALQEKISLEDNYLCDGPATTIKAYFQKDGVDDELLLYSTGGCGSPKKYRQGPASYALMDMANTFCTTTH